MSRLIDNVRCIIGRGRYSIQSPMSTLEDITSEVQSAAISPCMVEITFESIFRQHTQCLEKEIPSAKTAFINRLRWEIFGEFYEKTTELEQAAYEYNFDKVRTITMELQRMIRE